MKSILVILLMVSVQLSFAQTFTEMTGTPFEGVYVSSIAFSDVNGDGHDDVLITGQNNSNIPIAKLYTNDGTGTYTEMTDTPFEGVWASSIAFSDVNGDGNDDVLITGENNSDEPIAKLYTNDGTGTFTEISSTPFEGVVLRSIAFSDVNGNGYDDVLITGRNSLSEKITKLYTNDGTGAFAEMTGTPFDAISGSSTAFSDVNGDGTEDILITGITHSDGLIAKLYTNDRTGTFTEMTGTPFIGVQVGSISFSDINGDGTDDVLITGQNSSYERIAKLYINDGMVSSIGDLNTGNSLGFTLFPNPSASGTINLSYDSALNGELLIRVYGIDGVMISQQSKIAAIGEQSFSLDLSFLKTGAYLMKLDNGVHQGFSKFFVE